MSVPGKKTRRRRTRLVSEEEGPLYLDLVKATPVGEPILLVSGGKPGLGNPSFQSTEDRSPKYATKGGDGEMMRLELEVKAGGEVGLVGMPNAGKSTILRALTSSTPKVANYAFTTLNPHHGTCVIYSDSTFSGPRDHTSIITDTTLNSEYFSASPLPAAPSPSPPSHAASTQPHPRPPKKSEIFRFTLTDNPGLVPSSSQNVGLGHSFLRHIERSSTLIYVVDLSGVNPVGDLEVLRSELREYERMRGLGLGEEGNWEGEGGGKGLLGRIKGVVANKADLFGGGGVEGGEEAIRGTPEEGQSKLLALQTYLTQIEQEEVALGYRSAEDKIWLIPTSAKRRENVEVLVERLVEGVKEERKRTLERIREEERREEEERERAVEMISMRGR